MDEVKVGSRVSLPGSERHAVVEQFIGEGSQGTVYEAAIDPTRERVALKWYFRGQANRRQRESIELLIERGSPDSRFLWPLEIAEGDSLEDGFGYTMALRDETSRGLADLLRGKVDIPFSGVCTLGMELADTFLALHNEGLCYRDISFGNVFFSPETGRPLICDTDNVGINGASESAVLGTRRFMAPEIVRREAMPSTSTDLYSLAVLLFYVLMVGHPLIGRRELEFRQWDEHAESVLFGTDPIFIFDPDDRRNEPLPDIHKSVIVNWGLYPEEIRRLFIVAFTDGIGSPDNRVRESIWRSTLARSRDRITICQACRKENFWSEIDQSACWNCQRRLPDPVRLVIDGKPIVLNSDSTVAAHHLKLNYDFSTLVASVATHPDSPDRWGLRNEGTAIWNVTLPTGQHMEVRPGQAIGLRAGTLLEIGHSEARIAGGQTV